MTWAPNHDDMTRRQRFEEWARDGAGLDTSLRHSESPLDRAAYESSDTALAWEAWKAASEEKVRLPPMLDRIADAWNNLDPEHILAVQYSSLGDAILEAASAYRDEIAECDFGCTYPHCDCEQPEHGGCGRKDMHVIAYKFQSPNGSYWYIRADDKRTVDYWKDKRKLIPLTDDKARIAAGVVWENGEPPIGHYGIDGTHC